MKAAGTLVRNSTLNKVIIWSEQKLGTPCQILDYMWTKQGATSGGHDFSNII